MRDFRGFGGVSCGATVLLVAAACSTKAPLRDRTGAADAGDASAATDATPPVDAAPPPPVTREIGPFEVPFAGARTVYYVAPLIATGKQRLLANLHGVCNPPGYACGYWVNAASHFGFLVCPTGNSHCGGASGPPTWTEPVAQMDADLEKAIAIVDARHPGEIDREGAILTGFSLGAYSAVQIARNHPGRWPYLILNEANVALDAAQLRAAGVKAVALLAGERGAQVAGEKRTVDSLTKQGFSARLWVMKGAGHFYSADIDALMNEAVTFVLRGEGAASDAGAAR